ncbi:glycosyltransferase [Kushneria phosphatilytica]
MVLIEAAAHGVPLASFDCLAGPAEIIDDEHNGLLAEAENTQALAEILERLMSDESLRSSYSRRAYDSIDRFKPEIILPKWEALFEELSMTTSSTCRTD